MSEEVKSLLEMNSTCDSNSTLQPQASTDGRDLLTLSNTLTDEASSTSGFQLERKSIYSEVSSEFIKNEYIITDVQIPSEIGDLTLEVNSSSTGNLVGNESDENPSQNPSSEIAHVQSTISTSFMYQETKIIHLLSFDQGFESDNQSESESASLVSQPSNNPTYMLSKLLAEDCSDSVLRTVSASWKITYSSNKLEALKILVELMLHSAGCKCTLTSEFVLHLIKASLPVIDHWICQKLVNLTIDPSIWDDNYIDKIRKYLKLTLQSDVLMNIPFVTQLMYLVEAMVKSKWSSARFTALIFGGLIVKGYNKLYLQREAQSNNNLSPSTSLLALRHREIIHNTVDKLLGIILITLRDKEEVIRRFMFEVFWKWFHRWPEVFVNDIYLRHVNFAYFDGCLHIRFLTLQATGWLMSNYKSSGKLDLFATKTVPLLFERIHDVSATVAVEAIRAIQDLQRIMPMEEILKYGLPENIYLLIFNGEKSVASEAALYLYNSCVLSAHHSDPEKFNRDLIIFLFEANKMTKSGLLECKLVSSMFKHAHMLLTDWPAWRNLLLGDSLTNLIYLQEIACRLLYAIVSHCTGDTYTKLRFPPFPASIVDEVEQRPESAKVKKAREEQELYKLGLTGELASQMVQLWQKYKHDQKCLIPLINITQHFSNHVENIDMKKMCICLIITKKTVKINEKNLDNIFRSLSAIHSLMSASPRWKQEVLQLEKCLFDPVIKNYLDACQQLETSPNKSQESNSHADILKTALFLSKYFDLTSTAIPDTALKAFKFGAAKLNPQIISTVSLTCLYLSEWELKNIAEQKYAGNVLKAKLHSLSSHINTMYKLLGSLITSIDFKITGTAYSVLTTLLAIFCAKNVYVRPFSVIHLPQPSLVVCEWLSYCLRFGEYRDRLSKDESWFSKSHKSVDQFCTLILTGVLHVTYLSTLLPYFSIYKLKKNYNTALEDLVKLNQSPRFPCHLFNAMASLLTSYSHNTLENMANGICFVVINKIKPTHVMNNVAAQVVWSGMEFITTNKELSLFVVLAPFVKYMSKNQASKMKPVLIETFHLHLNHPCVKKAVDAFKQRLKKPKGQGRQSEPK